MRNHLEDEPVRLGERPFYKGPDLVAAEDMYLVPGKPVIAPVRVGRDNMPPVNQDTMYRIESTTRSGLALLGVEMFNINQALWHAVHDNRFDGLGLPKESFELDLGAKNNGGRDIVIWEGMPVVRLYIPSELNRIKGDDLVSQINPDPESGKEGIEIEGEKGKDWDFDYEDGKIVGLWIRVQKESRGFIPEDPEPIEVISGNGREFRDWALSYHKPIPRVDWYIKGKILWIGRVALTLPPHIDAELSGEAYDEIGGKVTGEQILSRLLDGGKNGRYIITEIRGTIEEQKATNFIKARLLYNGFSKPLRRPA